MKDRKMIVRTYERYSRVMPERLAMDVAQGEFHNVVIRALNCGARISDICKATGLWPAAVKRIKSRGKYGPESMVSEYVRISQKDILELITEEEWKKHNLNVKRYRIHKFAYSNYSELYTTYDEMFGYY